LCVAWLPALRADAADVDTVKFFNPCDSSDDLDGSNVGQIKGYDYEWRAKFNATINGDDQNNDAILVRIVDEDPDSDDRLLNITIECPPATLDDYVEVHVCYELMCDSDCDLKGAEMKWARVKKDGADYCGSESPDVSGTTLHEAQEANKFFDVVVEDVPDNENKGMLDIECAENESEAVYPLATPVPSPLPVATTPVITLGFLLAASGVVRLRNRKR